MSILRVSTKLSRPSALVTAGNAGVAVLKVQGKDPGRVLRFLFGRFTATTEAETAQLGKALKQVIDKRLIWFAEIDGEAAGVVVFLPNVNEAIADLKGKLLPFGWAKLLLWLRHPKVRTMRVPLMGVVKELQSSRMASQLAFMMIEYIRRASVERYGASRGEIGWILEDNQGMRSIAETIQSRVNKTYTVYEKTL